MSQEIDDFLLKLRAKMDEYNESFDRTQQARLKLLQKRAYEFLGEDYKPERVDYLESLANDLTREEIVTILQIKLGLIP